MQVFTFTATFSGYLTPEIITAKSQSELDEQVTNRLLADDDFVNLLETLSDDSPELELGSAERLRAERWVQDYLSRENGGTFTVTEELLNFLQINLFEQTLEVLSNFGYSTNLVESKEAASTLEVVLPTGLDEERFKQMARRLREKLNKIQGVDIGHAQSIQVLAECLYSKPFEEIKDTVLKAKEAPKTEVQEQASNEMFTLAPIKAHFSKSEDEIAVMVAEGILNALSTYMKDKGAHEVEYLDMRSGRPYWLTMPVYQAHNKSALNNMLKFCMGEDGVAKFLAAMENAGCTEVALPVVFEGESFGLAPSLFQNAEVFFLSPSYKEMQDSEMRTFERS